MLLRMSPQADMEHTGKECRMVFYYKTHFSSLSYTLTILTIGQIVHDFLFALCKPTNVRLSGLVISRTTNTDWVGQFNGIHYIPNANKPGMSLDLLMYIPKVSFLLIYTLKLLAFLS
jgi:hypothetical protein